MRRLARKIMTCFRATLGFLRMLFRPRAKVVAFSPNGHEILEGWDVCPEEKIIAEGIRTAQVQRPIARVALFCYEGANVGELFLLGKTLERIGKDVDSDIVLTPADPSSTEGFRVLINGVVTLMADPGAHFKLNGREEEKTELLDYDELELMNNRFVVLSCRGNAASEDYSYVHKGGGHA